eukprot:1588871-Prymnesium_polylepis.2
MPRTTSSIADGRVPYFANSVDEIAVLSQSQVDASGHDSSELGYVKKPRSGLRAMRVPFEHFAGFVEPRAGMRVPPLELVADAAALQKDWDVFATDLLQAVLEFKWHGYSRRAFTLELATFVASLAVAFAFNLCVAVLIARPQLAYPLDDVQDGEWAVLLLLYAINSCHVVLTGRRTFRMLWAVGPRKLASDVKVWVVLDMLYATSQLTVNVLLPFHRIAPEAISGLLPGTARLRQSTLSPRVTLQAIALLSYGFRALYY